MSNSNWGYKYSAEVQLMTFRTELLNASLETKVHKITPEEEKLYTRPRYQYTEFLDQFKNLKGGDTDE